MCSKIAAIDYKCSSPLYNGEAFEMLLFSLYKTWQFERFSPSILAFLYVLTTRTYLWKLWPTWSSYKCKLHAFFANVCMSCYRRYMNYYRTVWSLIRQHENSVHNWLLFFYGHCSCHSCNKCFLSFFILFIKKQRLLKIKHVYKS